MYIINRLKHGLFNIVLVSLNRYWDLWIMAHISHFLELLFLEFGQRVVIFYLQKVNKHWHSRKGWGKESNTVKGTNLYIINRLKHGFFNIVLVSLNRYWDLWIMVRSMQQMSFF
jgi:hypothetical protein